MMLGEIRNFEHRLEGMNWKFDVIHRAAKRYLEVVIIASGFSTQVHLIQPRKQIDLLVVMEGEDKHNLMVV